MTAHIMEKLFLFLFALTYATDCVRLPIDKGFSQFAINRLSTMQGGPR